MGKDSHHKILHQAAPILKRLASDFGVVSTYENEDIDLEFDFSNGSLRESINKQKKGYAAFGKMLSVFDEVIRNAVGIETHSDKYSGTRREQPNLKQTYVLASAFRDGTDIYPVRLTVKEFRKNERNKLHVAVCMENIKDAFSVQALQSQSDVIQYTPASSDISLAYLLENVKDEDLKKYIPKGFIKKETSEETDDIQYAIAKDSAETRADERAESGVNASMFSQREIAETYGEVKRTRRNLEKVQRRIQLTDEDKMHVGRLLRGEITAEYLPEGSDKEGVLAVYEAKQEYENYAKQIRKWNEQRKEGLRAQAREYLANIQKWKDKVHLGGLRYSRETMERNFRDIMGADADALIAEYLTPVHKAQAAATRLKNEMREKVRKLNLSRKVAAGNTVSEAHAAQLLGEAEDNIAVLKVMPKDTKRDGKTLSE